MLKQILSKSFWLLVIVAVDLMVFHTEWVLVPSFDTPKANAISVCPKGTYPIGDACKNEPTGCPYGDSVPMELCYKSVPMVLDEPVINWSASK